MHDATKSVHEDSDTVMIPSIIRSSILLLATVYVLGTSVLAQDQLVKFYPVGAPKYCKGCGHARSSYWKVTIRLENISGSDLILYGRQLGDEFYALNSFQRQNPNICEWEYGSGESIHRVPWNDMPDYERVPRVLKAGEIMDSEGDFGVFEGKTAKRYAAFVAKSRSVQPTEIFSTPFQPVFGSTPDAATVRLADDVCSPQCKVGISESPKIGGIQLGMSINDFRILYPKDKIDTLFQRPDTYKVAYIWARTSDAYSITSRLSMTRSEELSPSLNR